nr:Chain B, Apical Cap Protein 9 (AC9) [Toxoplasma gondii RH]6V6A_D Chain D, Apical Cap Protein 9 (AC9) [Toxoplasma gondii RH]
STRPKFVPCLSTAAAGAGSWMSGNREPSEYPQGM